MLCTSGELRRLGSAGRTSQRASNRCSVPWILLVPQIRSNRPPVPVFPASTRKKLLAVVAVSCPTALVYRPRQPRASQRKRSRGSFLTCSTNCGHRHCHSTGEKRPPSPYPAPVLISRRLFNVVFIITSTRPFQSNTRRAVRRANAPRRNSARRPACAAAPCRSSGRSLGTAPRARCPLRPREFPR